MSHEPANNPMETTPQKPLENGQPGSLRSGDLFGLLRTANRLTEIHSTVTRFCGDKWPTHRDQWQAIIRAKAAKENKQELAAAIELAKGSPEPMQSLVILAAAYEL